MKEGQLYTIKQQTVIEGGFTSNIGGAPNYPVLKGWRSWEHKEIRPPFIYLGYKYEDWVYNYQHTNKIHYILWKESVYVMDNQFAKHIIPLWEEEYG